MNVTEKVDMRMKIQVQISQEINWAASMQGLGIFRWVSQDFTTI